MFSNARNFNSDISGWNVSKVTNMNTMFTAAFSFNQNLGNWVRCACDLIYNAVTQSLRVTTIAAQNLVLDGHSPNYGIGTDGDSALFDMAGSDLVFKSTPSSTGLYTVTVTASGGDFGFDNHRELEVAVIASNVNEVPVLDTIGDQTVNEFVELTFTATASDDDALIFSLDGTFLHQVLPSQMMVISRSDPDRVAGRRPHHNGSGDRRQA